MNQSCLDIQSRLSAWLDGELPVDVSEVVRDHLAECSECRSLAESLQQLDATFEKVASGHHAAATRIAVNVLSAFANDHSGGAESLRNTNRTTPVAASPGAHTETTPATNETTSSTNTAGPAKPLTKNIWTYFLNPLVTAAAGFFLAWLIFAPSAREIAKNDKPPPEIGVKESEPPRVEPTLARLVAATGCVECRQPGQAEWSMLNEASDFHCSSGTKVRTAAGVRCELETDDHCTIRLNEETELAIRSPHEIELRCGQVWCSSTSDVELQVVAATLQRTESNASPALCFTCPAKGSVMSEMDSKGSWQIQSASGEVDVSLGETKRRLKRGEIARFDNGQLIIEPHHADSLLATSWMQPLLVLKGHDSPELGERVNRLLASLGQSKMDHLYEDEIRSMGDYAVLPLLRFVQSESSRNVPHQRLRAMSIVADVAPSWLIGDLIGLLADAEPQVRVHAAVALKRLTRQSQGREPAQWSAPLSEVNESLERWHIWWKNNSRRYELQQKGADPMKAKTA